MTLPLETARFEALKELAAARFGPIEPAEEQVLRRSASTEDAGVPEPGDRPKVRAAFLRWLATDKEAGGQTDPLGLRVQNAIIVSALDLDFCKLSVPLRFLRCTLLGELRLGFAEVPALYLLYCETEHGIFADGLRADGGVFLRGLEAGSELRFLSARIGGNLDCAGATLTARGYALSADGASIAGYVFLRDGFSCSGAIHFPGARIGRQLDCSGATLTAGGEALNADGAEIAGSVVLRKASCTGQVRFVGARIGGNLDCAGAILTATGDTLVADRTAISGDVNLREKFSCAGMMLFPGARIGGALSCSGARIRGLSCEDMRLDGSLIWTAIRAPEKAYLNLFGATVKALEDDAASWPARGKLVLKGLEYGGLLHHEPSTEEQLGRGFLAPQRALDARERVRWLCLQDDEPRLDPQPWMWLAKLFKEKGQDGDARRVLLSYRWRQARAGKWYMWPTGVLFAFLSWEPLLILLPFLLILCWGSQTYQRAWDQHQMRPTAADVLVQKSVGSAHPPAVDYASAYPVFNSWIYTLENELPVVRFGMDDKWAPDPDLIAKGEATTYWFLASFRWFLILAGWVQGILLTFGITRRFRD